MQMYFLALFLHLKEAAFFAFFLSFLCICLALSFLLLWQPMDKCVSHAPF